MASTIDELSIASMEEEVARDPKNRESLRVFTGGLRAAYAS
jgi:hypothetical protein